MSPAFPRNYTYESLQTPVNAIFFENKLLILPLIHCYNYNNELGVSMSLIYFKNKNVLLMFMNLRVTGVPPAKCRFTTLRDIELKNQQSKLFYRIKKTKGTLLERSHFVFLFM